MSTALLEPPATVDELRERAEELAGDVAEQLEPPVAGPAPPAFFGPLRAAVLSLARSPAWRSHDLTTELLLLVERLRDELDADRTGTDPEWRVREVLQRMLVVLRAMVRQLEHNELDRPEHAARFVAQALADVEVGQVAALLDTSPRMVANYRRGHVGQLRKNPARVTLVAQLVHELLGSMTARGVLLWFDARQLDGRTPRELIDEDPATHRAALIALARGGRAQTDRGGARLGAVDRAA
ncbi:MAG TPA: hypothetical protein VNS09_22665 [Solirubrobacter sp.]|nr:hypothetical protein [Solirubrobacter sp.]